MLLYLFESTHAVIKAEKKCLENGVKCKIVPVPKSISSQCGMCITVDPENEREVSKLLKETEINYYRKSLKE